MRYTKGFLVFMTVRLRKNSISGLNSQFQLCRTCFAPDASTEIPADPQQICRFIPEYINPPDNFERRSPAVAAVPLAVDLEPQSKQTPGEMKSTTRQSIGSTRFSLGSAHLKAEIHGDRDIQRN